MLPLLAGHLFAGAVAGAASRTATAPLVRKQQYVHGCLLPAQETSTSCREFALQVQWFRHVVLLAAARLMPSNTSAGTQETMRLIAMAGAPAAGMAVAQQAAKPSLVQMAQQLVTAHGWKALYRGNAMNVMRCAPSKALGEYSSRHDKLTPCASS